MQLGLIDWHRPQWKRLTIDVPVELHRRIKMACASRDLEMATWIRKLLETDVSRLENFPRKSSSAMVPAVAACCFGHD
jgi:hypothetical protein